MDGRLDWLGLATASPRATIDFYETGVGLPRAPSPDDVDPDPVAAFETPPGRLVFRPVTVEPCGGVHTHFAITAAPAAYDDLYARLDDRGDVVERTFGGRRSLYWIDPAGHCLEVGERGGVDAGYGRVFEIVLEVAALEDAIDRYRPLGFDPIDRDDDRPRVRLDGPFDLELWEPHLGIANGRGGCHVDIGLTVSDVDAAVAALGSPVRSTGDGRAFVRDGDGHTWWLQAAE